MSKPDSPAGVLDDPAGSPPDAIAVRDQVMATLGRPPFLHKVQVVRLWDNAYRANVFVGTVADVRIAHSFFIETTAAGEVVAAVPPLTRVYA